MEEKNHLGQNRDKKNLRQEKRKKTIAFSLIKTGKSLANITPILLGTVLLVGLSQALVPRSFYIKVFGSSYFASLLIGDLLGSLSAGNPIVSYILGGEMLKQGISLMAVTAFIVSWVTIGIVQLPAESMILGKRFAIVRNITAFILSLIVAVVTVLILRII